MKKRWVTLQRGQRQIVWNSPTLKFRVSNVDLQMALNDKAAFARRRAANFSGRTTDEEQMATAGKNN